MRKATTQKEPRGGNLSALAMLAVQNLPGAHLTAYNIPSFADLGKIGERKLAQPLDRLNGVCMIEVYQGRATLKTTATKNARDDSRDHCPVCGRFVEIDGDEYYVPDWTREYAVRACCDETCGNKHMEREPEGWEE